MELWLPVTVTAALLQTWRTAKQQKLRHLLSVNGTGFVRFLYGVPAGLVLLGIARLVIGQPVPDLNARFVLFCALGGLLQIIATNLLIMSFGFRNFAVGTAYAKTEAAQSAVVALLILGERLNIFAWIGIGIGVAGVLVLSLAGRGLKPSQVLAATTQPAAQCGLGAGFVFAFTTICVKLANRSLAGDATDTWTLVLCAVAGLCMTNTLQTLMQGSWLALREPAELKKVLSTWRSSWLVGTLSACGSCCWFTAFALAPVALVRSVGQVEVVFTLLFSRFYLKETLRPADVLGLCMVVFGVLVLVVGR